MRQFSLRYVRKKPRGKAANKALSRGFSLLPANLGSNQALKGLGVSIYKLNLICVVWEKVFYKSLTP